MKKHVRSIMIIVLAVASAFILCAAAVGVGDSSFNSEKLSGKIDAELLEVIGRAKNGELIPVSVSLAENDEEEIMAAFREDTGFDFAILRDEKLFDELIGKRIVSLIEEKIGEEEAHKRANVEAPDYKSPSAETVAALRSVLCNELKEFVGDPEEIIGALSADRSISVAEYAVLQARQTLQSARLRAVKSVRTAANEAFVSRYADAESNEVVYSSHYIATIFMKADKYCIAAMADDAETVCISYDDPDLFSEPDLSIADAQVGASTGAVLSGSSSARNNVEIIDYTTTTARKVYVQTRIYRNLSSVKTDWALEVDRW